MTRHCRNVVLGLTLWLAAAGMAVAAQTPPRPDDLQASRQQVLVFLRLPPQHFRPNADYSGSYGDAQGQAARHRIASRLAHDHGLSLVSDWPLPLLGVDCFVMAVPAGRSPDAVAGDLAHDPGVAWAEPMQVYRAKGREAPPDDPLFRVQPAAREWRLADLHEIATGRNVRVAVVDSRIEVTHPDLAGQIQVSENFVAGGGDGAEQHGTGVAGIIAAKADNGMGIAGVAPEARLLALRACWQPASGGAVCDSLSLAKALHFAVAHDAQVINLSLSGPPDPLLGKLLDLAMARGAAVVGAYDPDLPLGGFPASHPGVVAVADESIGGAIPGVYKAPGRDIPTTQPGGRWYLVNGSSFAAAHVTGLFALMRERAASARDGSALVAARSDGGPIDACASLVRIVRPCGCACSHARNDAASARQ